MSQQFDVDRENPNQRLEVTTEFEDERSARLARIKRQQTFDLWIKGGLFGLLTFGAVYSLWVLNSGTTTPDAKDAARTIIGTVVGAFAGYFAGKAP